MLIQVALMLSFAEPPDAITAATELQRTVLACKEMLGTVEPVSNRITGEDAVLCVQLPRGALRLVRVSGGVASAASGFIVDLVRRNGANSDYKVVRPEGGRVYGILTNVTSTKVKVGTKIVRRKRVPVFKDRAVSTIYVPYSEAVAEPVAIGHGRDYIDMIVEKARNRLDELGVTSRLDADKPVEERRPVTEIVSKRSVIPLLIIEHIDPIWITQYGLQHSIDRVFTTVGLNGEASYGFAASTAKANGFAQFIKPTYDRIRAEYPEAQLMPDYVAGMKDHLNAVVAQFCLADFTLTKLSQESLIRLMDGSHEEDLGAYIAAAYNGGEHYAAPAYDHDPERWDDHPEIVVPKRIKGKKKRNAWYRKQLITKHLIPDQTVVYVREFRLVYRNLYVHDAPPNSPQPPLD